MRRTIRWAVIGIATIVTLLLLVIATAVLILDTESGTRWALKRVETMLDGKLTTGQVDGTMWQGLRFSAPSYEDAERRVEAINLAFSINWSTLAVGRLTFQQVDISALQFHDLSVAKRHAEPFALAMPPLPLDVTIGRLSVREFALARRGESILISDIAIKNARIDDRTIRVQELSATAKGASLSATKVKTTLAGDIPFRADINWKLLHSEWAGAGKANGSLALLSFEHTTTGPYPGNASGTLRLLGLIKPEFDALVNWDAWTFGDYELAGGTVNVRGVTDDYDGDYEVMLNLPGDKHYLVTGTASGDSERLSAFAAKVDNPSGRAELSGSLRWIPAFAAEAQVQASDLDPAIISPLFAGKLGADAHVTIDERNRVSITGLTVRGILNGAPLDASGDVLFEPRLRRCIRCALAVGDNRLTLDGESTGDEVALALTIDATNLAELWPGLSGTASGAGTLVGSIQHPTFTGRLKAQQLRYKDWFSQSIAIDSRESALDSLDFDAALVAIAHNEDDFGTIVAHGNGQLDALEIDVAWDLRGLTIRADGVLQHLDAGFNGVIRTATIVEPSSGEWRLTNEFAVQQTAGMTLTVEAHTWTGENGELSIQNLAIADNEVSIVAKLENLPLQIANSLLPENYQLLGFATAYVDVVQRAGLWSGTVNWHQSGTVLRVTDSNDLTTDVIIPLVELSTNLADNSVLAKAALEIEPGVRGELDFALAQFAANAPMSANLRLYGDDWSWLSAAVPQIDSFAGSIAASITAEGPLNAPEFGGNLAWNDGRLLVPALNVPIDEIDLLVSGASQGTATVNGSARAGDGTLRVTGRFDNLMQPTRSLRLELSGESAQLIDWPEYQLWATPDLVIAGNDAGWQISGQLAVPRAVVSLREVPVEAVRISPDVTVLGEETTTTPATTYSGEVRLLLGERVRINALGLDSRLVGELLVRMPQDRPMTAEGRVSLVDGTFTAYGQKLVIQQGDLTFTGPLDDPIVDVRAVRVIDTFAGTVTAGIRLRGRARDLTSTVYSEPTMADADALSYLIIGRPLNQATESEGGELSGAAMALGLRQASRLTDQLGQSVGLDQLSVTGDGGDTTALVAGKQINKRLHARYAYGVFNRLGTLLLRYRLSRGLVLEAGAGEVQSIDVLYTVEKD